MGQHKIGWQKHLEKLQRKTLMGASKRQECVSLAKTANLETNKKMEDLKLAIEEKTQSANKVNTFDFHLRAKNINK